MAFLDAVKHETFSCINKLWQQPNWDEHLTKNKYFRIKINFYANKLNLQLKLNAYTNSFIRIAHIIADSSQLITISVGK